MCNDYDEIDVNGVSFDDYPDERYHVNYWGSHPDEDNDDCFAGDEFDDREAALEFFRKTPTDSYCKGSVAFVEIDGPDIYEVRAEPSFRPDRNDCDDWRREQAMQSAMAHGCVGWNDYYG